MNGFAMLWSKILESSLWVQESKETRLVWITLLAMKNSEGEVFASVVGLADRAKVSLEECRTALQVLMSPDKNDTSGVDEGRRLHAIPGGWRIVNHDLYRFTTEAKRAAWPEIKRQERARKDAEMKRALAAVGKQQKGKKHFKRSTPLAGEDAFVAMERAGQDVSLEPGNMIPLPVTDGGKPIPDHAPRFPGDRSAHPRPADLDQVIRAPAGMERSDAPPPGPYPFDQLLLSKKDGRYYRYVESYGSGAHRLRDDTGEFVAVPALEAYEPVAEEEEQHPED